ncbi:cytidylate kinase family protein [uncultured Kordia sp.]|uniref:cytidylate kinase family protein n=1 Tax=uncultured Kordia sp. TaxID=507699 RepID=UPI00260BA4FB|nr:cytidylate kinase family protein [uncultured Kordia sp.]
MKNIIVQEKKMITKISLSGFAGSGKSTIGKNIQEMLGFEFISVGNFSREFAKNEYGMNINEFQQLCKQHPKLDAIIDNKFKEKCNALENIVIDYRLGFKFLNNTFHVLLKVSDTVAQDRISAANRGNEITTAVAIKKRNKEMQQRFKMKYDVDFMDESNYHLIINTDNLTSKEVTDFIITKFQKFNQK